MLVQFTRASQKDKLSRVTVTGSFVRRGLGMDHEDTQDDFDYVDNVIITIQHGRRLHQVFFCRNRNGTFKTTSWPAGLSYPLVGEPVTLMVTDITQVDLM